MGVAGTLSCTNFEYSQHVFVGIRFRFLDLRSILEWYKSEKGREQIKAFMREEDARVVCYKGVYACEHCGYLLNEVYLYNDSHTQSYTNHYDCPRCHTQMPEQPFQREVEIECLNCPECEGGKLDVSYYMDWD